MTRSLSSRIARATALLLMPVIVGAVLLSCTAWPVMTPLRPVATRAVAAKVVTGIPLLSSTPTSTVVPTVIPSATTLPTLTSSPSPTPTTARRLASPTASPQLGEIRIEGLDAWALECGVLRFFQGDRQLAEVSLRDYADGLVSYPYGEADWIAFYGSPDGQCPWKRYTPHGFDPKHIAITEQVLLLRFDKIVSKPKPTTPPSSP